MADLTSVGVTSGIPSSGTGTVATINYLTQVGAPISNGSTTAPVTVAITGTASAVTSTMSALVVTLSPNSSTRLMTLSSNPTVIPSSAIQVTLTSNVVALSSNPTVILSSNPTVIASSVWTVTLSSNPTVLGSSQVAIIGGVSGANTANVLAGSSLVTSTMAALVVAMSSNGAGIIATGTVGSQSSQYLSVQGSSVGTPVATMYSTTGLGGTNSSLSAPVVNADQYGQYTVVAASNTRFSLGSSAGRSGDYLAYLTVFPTVAASGSLTIFDSTTTTIGSFAGGGTTALPSLIPFRIDIGAYSASSGWKVTTSSNISCVAIGKFT